LNIKRPPWPRCQKIHQFSWFLTHCFGSCWLYKDPPQIIKTLKISAVTNNPEPIMQIYTCAQCPATFNSISQRKNHVRDEHQLVVHSHDANSNPITIHRVNNLFSCSSIGCSYSTAKASLMQTHFSKCRFKVTRPRQPVVHPPQSLAVRCRINKPNINHIEGMFLFFFLISIPFLD
jgi:hypothetical protein